MRPQACLQILKPLLSKPSFTSKEAKTYGVPSAVLSYYVKSGKLKRIRRGVYQSSHYHNKKAFRWADLIEAVYSVNDGVICLISALAIYDLTEEIPRQHWIGICHKTSIRSNRQMKIIRFRDLTLGKIDIELEGVRVSIFDRERTIVDAFRLLSREIAIKALKLAVRGGKNRINFIKLEEYAKKLQFDISPYLMSITT
ncbi:type IV toxin-antitoxin system AbiEi family antitoxin domain-containing protein [Rhabdochlamydiaceae symbiont of Dictyostelium giganteum]|uniref:type IV toxin-antitoxin system AbiEi family antitoxin domain-containing protein n=1 Tax=Rhabdochlamydiaceae symbiont of Dictyostelium giganteum TaxID=3342349 RepID=UPI00384F2706